MISRDSERSPVPALALLLKPSHTAAGAACKLGYYAGVDVPARVGAPGNEAGAPIHMLAETIPAPIRLAANIANLRKCHRYDVAAATGDPIENLCPEFFVFIG